MTPSLSSLADRDLRQRQIVPPEKLAACHAIVIGVGAIGRQVAIQLAAVGISHLTLIDPDTVGAENLAPQAYWPGDVGGMKVDATGALCHLIHPQCAITPVPRRFARSMIKTIDGPTSTGNTKRQTIVFACVDCMTARALIWESVRPSASFFVDGRMSAEVIRVLAAADPGTDSYYPTTLFAPEQAFVGSCTAKSTVYTAAVAAGLMLGQFTKWLRGLGVERDLMLNLLAGEWVVQ